MPPWLQRDHTYRDRGDWLIYINPPFGFDRGDGLPSQRSKGRLVKAALSVSDEISCQSASPAWDAV